MEEQNIHKRFGNEEIWLNDVRNRKSELEKLVNNKEKSILTYPEGHLRVQDKKSYAQYYWIKQTGDTNGEYLPKKKIKTAKKLAQKDYDVRLLSMAKKELKIVTKYLDYLEENDMTMIYSKLNDKRRELVEPFIYSDDDYVKMWKSQSYEPMGFDENSSEYYSDSGLRVRSKSEIIIANMLEKYGIPFKYECPLNFGKNGMVRPDFTCLNVRKRKEIIWEHFGMMDNEEYACKNVRKISAYEEHGFHMGNSLIMTFETSQQPINSNIIKTMIVQNLL